MAGGVILNYIGVAVLSGIGFFLTPYIIKTVGATSYGVLALSIAMLNYASLLDFGIGISVMKLIADRVHETDQGGTRTIVSTILVLYTVVGVLAAGVALLIYPAISGSFHVPSQYEGVQRGHGRPSRLWPAVKNRGRFRALLVDRHDHHPQDRGRHRVVGHLRSCVRGLAVHSQGRGCPTALRDLVRAS
jgi:hypothetical protein